ncbi:hypothetical protein SAMN04488005_1225 [Yoonia tamlensis]|uniref:DUF1476 domain-containing protein n=1 Tax=Yoonia tamlensis TaxID=390270 RepID=A0A1I6G855_9RHOB|nr:DUF1476 domain-containing protein [Yoonia tamlensis]SFR38376.1 hypothetical protein SAMN04488005_1225 [Yoonia tamlensis]
MNTLEERERAFEAKFAHDQEMQFNAIARRNHLLGEWAAALLDKNISETAAYADEIVKVGTAARDDSVILQKLAADLGPRVDGATLHAQMTTLLQEAKAQVLREC